VSAVTPGIATFGPRYLIGWVVVRLRFCSRLSHASGVRLLVLPLDSSQGLLILLLDRIRFWLQFQRLLDDIVTGKRVKIYDQ